MSWRNARESAAILAERLKKIEQRPAAGPSRPQRATPAEAAPASEPPPVYVKPPRKPLPPAEAVARAIDEDLAIDDLIDDVDADSAEQSSTSAETAEGRRAPRKNHVLPAYITGTGMSNTIPARVIDMSATGAKVELTPMGRATGVPMTEMPEKYILVLKHDKMEVDCETVWRRDWMIGVRFLGFPRPIQPQRR
ncbi:MAG: PilZ domain-containing protein [Hyphomicrobiaceae bacterium]